MEAGERITPGGISRTENGHMDVKASTVDGLLKMYHMYGGCTIEIEVRDAWKTSLSARMKTSKKMSWERDVVMGIGP